MTIDETTRAPRGRSPSYPGIALETAIQRTRAAYDKLRTHAAPIGTFASLWGFASPTSGTASVTLAALKKYGLLDQEGNGDARTARLTTLAVDILMKPDSAPSIQQAALTPPIYKEMWDKYRSDVPPEDALRYEFVVQRGFTESGFRDFLRIYLDTIAFANLAGPGQEDPEPASEMTLGAEHDEPTNPRNQARTPPTTARNESSTTSYTVPVAPGLNIIVDGQFPLTPKAWGQFMAVLEAMRPALVEDQVLTSDAD